MGEIYLGRTSTDYVLPHSWMWFAQDVAQTRPVAFVETNPREPGTPFDALIKDHFVPVMATAHDTVYLRSDVAGEVLDSGAGPALAPRRLEPDAPQTFTRSCTRIDGTITTAGGGVRFQFIDTTGATEPLHLSFDSKRATAGSYFVDYLSLPLDASPDRFALVVGRRAAALVLDGKIRAALRLPASVAVTAAATGTPVDLSGLTATVMRPRSGC
jgi:hypothetical protein